ncbi:thimet oligopeptidase [Hamadaea flava]|uniref:M3 family metallopeptidase n=1 Tax=Hamadaea flava TaxID=1742688 RepID=A0ABV8LU70_9ACTN|nr:M3 family metallopeptidase [Hamadaea flava]MCP2328231.1 thimet oligopeptidase [Hamadaea flava]
MQDTSAAAALVAGGSDALTTAADETAATAAGHLGDFLATGTLTAYDEAVSSLSRVRNLAKLAQMAHPDADVRATAATVQQDIDKRLTEISLDPAVYQTLAGLDLTAEDAATRHWVGRVLRDMRLAGVDRDDETRARVRALQDELTATGQAFERTIASDTRTAEVPPSALDGLPDDYVAAHPAGDDGLVRITTDYPDYIPFMTYSRDAAAREQLWRLNTMRGFPDNEANLRRLLELRRELAGLLGFATWADFVTANKMIGSEQAIADFVARISDAARDRSGRDYAVLLERKRADDPTADTVEPWDNNYLTDRVRAEQFAFDSQTVRPYLEYTAVKDGLMAVAAQMFGVEFRPVEQPVWHPEVEAYDVVENDAVLGRIYLDMHPRADKFSHAAMFTMVVGKRGRTPECTLLCNLPNPANGRALLQPTDVRTFFHEFGHLLHQIFASAGRWSGVGGVSVEWDFVEAPSQLLEEWVRDHGVLARFARHADTGEILPAETVVAMRAAEEFGKGMSVRQQMFYAALSLELHRRDPSTLDIPAVEKELMELHTPFRHPAGSKFHLSFGHLNGYSAMYYTYMWSLVIAKDLFTAFDPDDLLATGPAGRYRQTVIGRGGSAPAAELIRDFLGRDYRFDAFQAWLED